jgi:hypothetical protein
VLSQKANARLRQLRIRERNSKAISRILRWKKTTEGRTWAWIRLALAILATTAVLGSSHARSLEVRITPEAVKKAVEVAAFVNGQLSSEAPGGIIRITLKHLRVRFASPRVFLDTDAETTPPLLTSVSVSCRPKAEGAELSLEDIRVENLGAGFLQDQIGDLVRSAMGTPKLNLLEKARSPIEAPPYRLLVSSPVVTNLRMTNAYIGVDLDGTITIE